MGVVLSIFSKLEQLRSFMNYDLRVSVLAKPLGERKPIASRMPYINFVVK